MVRDGAEDPLTELIDGIGRALRQLDAKLERVLDGQQDQVATIAASQREELYRLQEAISARLDKIERRLNLINKEPA